MRRHGLGDLEEPEIEKFLSRFQGILEAENKSERPIGDLLSLDDFLLYVELSFDEIETKVDMAFIGWTP